MGTSNNSVSANDNHVNVGNFDVAGLNVNNYWNDNHNDNLGLAGARNFNLLCFEALSIL